MASIALTEKDVAKLQSSGEEAQIYDTRARGLVLRIRKGGKLSWSVVYTGPEGKKRRMTLTGADTLSLDAARKAARRIVGDAAAGRIQAKETPTDEGDAPMTLRDLLAAYFASPKFAKLRSKAGPRYSLMAHIEPAFGHKNAKEITRAELAVHFDKLASGGKNVEGKPGAALHAQAYLSAALSWATDRGLIDANPIAGMSKAGAVKARERVLSLDEIRTILEKIPDAPLLAATRQIIQLLILTGARVAEIAELRRAEVDMTAQALRLPAARVKNGRAFTIPLTPPALATVQDAFAASEHSEFLFPSPRDWRQPIAAHAISVALRRTQKHFALPHWTAHDFRRAIATGLSNEGTPPHIVETLLNHTPPGVTARHYNLSKYEGEHRQALEKWARMIGQT